MKLFNAIAIYDVYVVAETPEAAVEALKNWIKDPNFKPTEETSLETRSENNIRLSWQSQKPLVGEDISDDDFEKLKGKTTLDAYKMIYTKGR